MLPSEAKWISAYFASPDNVALGTVLNIDGGIPPTETVFH
jgi:hypothetical protein